MLLFFIFLFVNSNLLFGQQFQAAQRIIPFEGSENNQIERQSQTTVDPVLSSVRGKILDDYREYLDTLNSDEQKEEIVELIKKQVDIPTEDIIDEQHDSKMVHQETLTKQSDSKAVKNKEITTGLKKSVALEEANVRNIPIKVVTSDGDATKTKYRKKEENISSDDHHKEENEPAAERNESTPETPGRAGDSKIIDISDGSGETLIIDGMDDAQLDKLVEIISMERKNTKKEQSTERKQYRDDTTSRNLTKLDGPNVRMPQSTTTMLPYFQMIDDLNEGYMVVFLIELMRIMAYKDKDDLFEVLVHTEQIVLQKLSGRQQELSSEVNTIIDYADMLYDDEEGRKLFSVLKDFDEYPNTTQRGYTVCLALIENFLKPYRRLSNTELRQQLLDSINLELRARIPEADREGNVLKFLGISEEMQQRPSVESDSGTFSFSRKIQNKLRQKLQKLKSKPKHTSNKRKKTITQPDYSNENIFRRRFSNDPIANIQRRFKIVTRTLPHRSTASSYTVNLISRPTKEFTTKLNKANNQKN
ncbi:hypothetical protein HF086_006483 [Spodoptera exigua]|uniref:Uncharacterized protein n=1 Tax=Spodoptera exigua TaxID=7107 RepID=A0A922M6A5_SPOEX|nr:hypothetical protein HF086_006483 [Spodoptera exigua]